MSICILLPVYAPFFFVCCPMWEFAFLFEIVRFACFFFVIDHYLLVVCITQDTDHQNLMQTGQIFDIHRIFATTHCILLYIDRQNLLLWSHCILIAAYEKPINFSSNKNNRTHSLDSIFQFISNRNVAFGFMLISVKNEMHIHLEMRICRGRENKWKINTNMPIVWFYTYSVDRRWYAI